MNSDVGGSGGGGRKSREHRRYLSIGESEGSAIFEDEEEQEGGGGSDSRRGSRGLFSRVEGVAGGERGDDGRGVNGKENVAGPTREMRVFGGMTRLGPLGNGANRFGKSRSGSMYDGDGFLREVDAWMR